MAEGVRVLLFENDGYLGAPGAAGIARVFGTWLVGPDGFWGKEVGGNVRIRILFGGAEKMSPTSSVMIAMAFDIKK